MPRGGRRPGAGRKPAGEGKSSVKRVSPCKAIVKAREEIDAEIKARDPSRPKMRAVEFMDLNMHWAHRKADDLLQDLRKAAERNEFAVAIDWFNESCRVRAFGQRCAEQLAPYQDPKLIATVPAPEEPPAMKDITPSAEGYDHLKHLTERYGKAAVVEGGQKKKA